jgi:hypothetical protein
VQVACIRGKRDAYRVLVSESEGKRPPGKPSCRWNGNNKTDFKEREWEDVDWIHLAQDMNKCRALVKKVMNILIA